MDDEATVRCKVFGFRPVFKTQTIAPGTDPAEATPSQEVVFRRGDYPHLGVTGELGPHGLSPRAADLVDLGSTVFHVEKQLSGRQRTNPPARFQLVLPVRDPRAWTSRAVELAQQMLLLLGNAEWSLEFTTGLAAPGPEHSRADAGPVEQVALFSGGMDSTCGLAALHEEQERTRLVSFYTRQKALQRELASSLDYRTPVQWGRTWKPAAGRGRSFYYRSFLFLCLAAATAESWQARRILQFENGILASAIPPSPYWMMTKHAHPQLHKLAGLLFEELFGGQWRVDNPFALRTKRGGLDQAAQRIGRARAEQAVAKSETCWFYASNRLMAPAEEELRSRVVDGKSSWEKTPNTPCGVCIPCLIRSTAFRGDADRYRWNLREDAVKNDPLIGRAFRSYTLFLQDVSRTRGAPAHFYRLLPDAGRNLLRLEPYSLESLHQLFIRFADEFLETYDLRGGEL